MAEEQVVVTPEGAGHIRSRNEVTDVVFVATELSRGTHTVDLVESAALSNRLELVKVVVVSAVLIGESDLTSRVESETEGENCISNFLALLGVLSKVRQTNSLNVLSGGVEFGGEGQQAHGRDSWDVVGEVISEEVP